MSRRPSGVIWRTAQVWFGASSMVTANRASEVRTSHPLPVPVPSEKYGRACSGVSGDNECSFSAASTAAASGKALRQSEVNIWVRDASLTYSWVGTLVSAGGGG